MKLVSLAPMLLFPILFFHKAEAANDSARPCFDGSCSLDIAHTNTSMGGTFSINGSSTSISDITPAAGWDILNCTTSTNSQTIQLVCTDETKGCDHLFQDGAEHTIIRLPDNCGAGPFVRVAKHWIPANQSLPTHVASRVRRSNGTTPQVHLLQIDGNFNESASSGRTVGFSLVASTVPALAGGSSLVPAPNPSRRHARNLHSRNANPAPDEPNPLFSDSTSKSFSVGFDESFVLFNSTLLCAGNENENVELTLEIDADTDVNFDFTISFVISGNILPPKVTKLGASATIDGTFDGTLNIDAGIIGTLDTGEIDLFSVGIPGLSIADILSIGPTFDLFGEASATIELDADVSVGVHYELNGLSFTVGSSTTSTPGFTPLDSPVQFSIDPSITANAILEAHLIPTLTLGISAFSNTVDVFVNLDAALEADLNATAGASESAEACVDISSPISFNIGATGSFFGIIDESLSVPIFEETFQIFQKCFTQTALATSARNATNISASSPASSGAIRSTSTSSSRPFTSRADSGGLVESGGPGRLEYGGVQSGISTGYDRKRRQSGRRAPTPFGKRDVFAKRFTCPSSSDSAPITGETDVPAAK